MIINAKEDYQAEYGSKVATNKEVLAREDAKEIISLITNVKERYQAKYGIKVMTNKEVLAREDAKEIIGLIINAKEVYQVLYGIEVATNKEVLAREDAKEIIKEKTDGIAYITDLYKEYFDADSYIEFIYRLENSSPEAIKLFVKKLKNR